MAFGKAEAGLIGRHWKADGKGSDAFTPLPFCRIT